MSKKSKCATAFLATALLSYGFTLDKEQENTTVEPKTQREVAVEKESTPIIEPQHLIAEEEIKVEIFACQGQRGCAQMTSFMHKSHH